MYNIVGNSYSKTINGDVIIRTVVDFNYYDNDEVQGYYKCTRVRITRKGEVITDKNIKIDADIFLQKICFGDWKLIR